jgi:hypothetical protein
MAPDRRTGEDIVRRARSRLGERRYHLVEEQLRALLQLVPARRVPQRTGRSSRETRAIAHRHLAGPL